ncbi:MAG TPA: serine/threonine-protein kinase [Gemmatimonadaceae bacterium]|nr:serine/threonine-protein kinase [Gemmatimonadaceae bacterium]
MSRIQTLGPYTVTGGVARHLEEWRLPPGWRWGTESVAAEHRHFQEVIDALDRPLSLVTAPDPLHDEWLRAETRHLAQLSHPSIPTAYHYWVRERDPRRGPGYLRRWIVGETVGARIQREGPEDFAHALQILRATGSALAYLHDLGAAYGALSPHSIWITPGTRIWLAWWQWTVEPALIPAGLTPGYKWVPWAPEWRGTSWRPTAASDQWQLAASAFAALTGELPPNVDTPPIQWVRPEVPGDVAAALDRALAADPQDRFPTVAALLRAVDRAIGSRTVLVSGVGEARGGRGGDGASQEQRLRWALGDEYEVLAALGRGTFGSVWRVRDLSLEREVALKVLHPEVAMDQSAVGRFRREARLAAQLAHPAIVPVYDWDSRGDVTWYTMELAEGGSLADLIARQGPQRLDDVVPQITSVLEALSAAHQSGIVHRDLKPENILLDRYRRARIADFGIADAVEHEPSGATGTPAFAAPEQLLGETQGPPVDCFAVGGLVYFALSGKPPFGEGDPKQILARQLGGVVDLNAFPSPLAEWLRRALAPAPADRFADATEMLAAFRQCVRSLRFARLPWWRRWSVAAREWGVRRSGQSPGPRSRGA